LQPERRPLFSVWQTASRYARVGDKRAAAVIAVELAGLRRRDGDGVLHDQLTDFGGWRFAGQAEAWILATRRRIEQPLWVKDGRVFHLSACVARGRCASKSGRREHDPTANSTFGLAQETIAPCLLRQGLALQAVPCAGSPCGDAPTAIAIASNKLSTEEVNERHRAACAYL
jgi:hypothetical protein